MPPERLRLVCAALFIVCASARAAVILSPVRNISNDAALSVHPRVAQDPAGNLHVVWAGDDIPRPLHYAKGTWNGATHTFGAVATLGNVGSYGYANPNVTVACFILQLWSPSDLAHIENTNCRLVHLLLKCISRYLSPLT